MITRSFSWLTLLALAAACTDGAADPVAPDPAPGAPAGAALISCRADVRAGEVRCSPASPGAGGAGADLILGGQGSYVQLANDAITVAGGVFSTDVTVQNLTVQPMGTVDGATPSPRGVRVFFLAGPTNGVQVANPDGVEMYTGPAQPYFQYDGVLQPEGVSVARRWSFDLNGETDSFRFEVYVVAEVPSEAGMLRLEQVAGAFGRLTGVDDVWMDSSGVVGVGYGTIFRSTDGGRNWRLVFSGTPTYLLSVHGDGQTVVTVGWNGTILRSTNRGATWHLTASGTTRHLQGVWGRGSTFIAVGAGGTILRSTDAGFTWSSVPSGTTRELRGVWGADSTVLAVGDDGTLLRSTDEGATWAEVASGTTAGLLSVWGEGPLFVVGSEVEVYCDEKAPCPVILRSADSGATWATSSVQAEHGVHSLWGRGSVVLAGIEGGGLDGGGEMFRSTDGGATWARAATDTYYHQELSSIAGWGATVVAIGSRDFAGVIFRSADLGITWKNPSVESYQGAWSDGTTAVVVGAEYYRRIDRSVDGGATWSAAAYPGSGRLFGVWGGDSTLVAVGDGGSILRSADRGATWRSVNSGSTTNLADVGGDGTLVLAVGDAGTILRSTSGGTEWSAVASGTTQRLSAVWVRGSTAIAVGGDYRSGTILRSKDAGATWSQVVASDETFDGVWGTGQTMIAVGPGGHVRRSTNGGATWAVVSTGASEWLTDVSGHGSTVIAVGAGGILLRSQDAGATWHRLRGPTTLLLSAVWVVDPGNVVTAGQNGIILRGMR